MISENALEQERLQMTTYMAQALCMLDN